MSLRRKLTRRQAGAGIASAFMAAAMSGKPAELPRGTTVSFATWEQEDCPGCSLPVYFLPGQASNKCGHCGAAVGHALA